MKSIKDTGKTKLSWIQRKALKRHFALCDGEETIGTLEWKSDSGSLVTGSVAEGTWAFKRTGVFKFVVSIREAEQGNEIAIFKPDWRGQGLLEFPDGPTYKWMQKSWIKNAWDLTTQDDKTLLTVRQMQGLKSILKEEGEIELAPEILEDPNMPLLVLLGWYLTLLHAYDSATAAAT